MASSTMSGFINYRCVNVVYSVVLKDLCIIISFQIWPLDHSGRFSKRTGKICPREKCEENRYGNVITDFFCCIFKKNK